jgi:hypothetical protein
MSDYRERLIEEAERAHRLDKLKTMTTDELKAELAVVMGLPPGTLLTDEQIHMVARARYPHLATRLDAMRGRGARISEPL